MLEVIPRRGFFLILKAAYCFQMLKQLFTMINCNTNISEMYSTVAHFSPYDCLTALCYFSINLNYVFRN